MRVRQQTIAPTSRPLPARHDYRIRGSRNRPPPATAPHNPPRPQRDAALFLRQCLLATGQFVVVKPVLALGKVGLEPNTKKFQVFGTTEDACTDKPEWLDETFVIEDPAEGARVEVAEDSITVVDALIAAEFAKSKGEARRLIKGGAGLPYKLVFTRVLSASPKAEHHSSV